MIFFKRYNNKHQPTGKHSQRCIIIGHGSFNRAIPKYFVFNFNPNQMSVGRAEKGNI